MDTLDLIDIGISFLHSEKDEDCKESSVGAQALELMTMDSSSPEKQPFDQEQADPGHSLVQVNLKTTEELTPDLILSDTGNVPNDSDKESRHGDYDPKHTDTDEEDGAEKARYAYLCRLLLEGGAEALRQVFNMIHPAISLPDRLSKPDVLKILRRLRIQNVISAKQWETLYPKHRRLISSLNYDAPLLAILLQSICHISPPYPNGWRGVPLSMDTSISADIARVSYFRNLLASRHKPSAAEFKTHKAQLQGVLVRLGGKGMRAKLDRLAEDTIQVQLQNTWINKVRVSSLYQCIAVFNYQITIKKIFPLNLTFFLFFFFNKCFWRTRSHFLFWGFLVTSHLGFKARVGCFICIAEATVMYVPLHPPLVLHITNLLMLRIEGLQFKMMAQHCHLLAQHTPQNLA